VGDGYPSTSEACGRATRFSLPAAYRRGRGVGARDEEVTALPYVSVVVPHYNDLVRLRTCLDALCGQTLPIGSFEIVVADNASPVERHALDEVIAGRARLVVVDQRGAGPARNGGVNCARGEILAFTDCDCVPEPKWLEEGLRALGAGDLVGGAMRVLVDDAGSMTGAEAFELEFAFDNEQYVKRKSFSVTANLFCRREVFEAVGGFGVGISEDFDWCRRAKALGFKITYAPSAIVGHPARRNWVELRHKWARLNRESFATFAGTPVGRIAWFARSVALPASAIVHTPRVLLSNKLPRAGDKLAAIRVLYGVRLWRCLDALRLALAAGGRRR